MVKRVRNKVEGYFDDTQILYNILWSKALHYGFWDEGTRSLPEAVENTDRFVSRLLALQKNDYVLDAGCGVGGSCFFMAKNFGNKVIGITVSSKQARQARREAEKLGLSDRAKFEVMDFNHTTFNDATFSKIFSIEAVCHACCKLDFLREAYRLLTPGGKIVIVDGFLQKRNLSDKEKKIYEKCLRGFKVPNLSHRDDFYNDLNEVGFKNISFYDKTEEVMPSSRRIALYGYFSLPVAFIMSKTGVMSWNVYDHTIACINQRKTFHNFTIYGVFCAEK